MVDIINLAIYNTVQRQKPDNDLPPLKALPAFKKLPPLLQILTAQQRLLIIEDNFEEISQIIESIR